MFHQINRPLKVPTRETASCLALKVHPASARAAFRVAPPDGKRVASTTDWPHFLARGYVGR